MLGFFLGFSGVLGGRLGSVQLTLAQMREGSEWIALRGDTHTRSARVSNPEANAE